MIGSPRRGRGSRVRRSAWIPGRPLVAPSSASPRACRSPAPPSPPAAAPAPGQQRQRRQRWRRRATYWFLTGQPGESDPQGQRSKRFNKANPDSKIKSTTFQNDAYKTKIKTAIGAGQAPTIIWGWGGGGLKSYVEADQVEDLTVLVRRRTPT